MALCLSFYGKSQIAISALPTYTGSVNGGYVPIVIGGVTKKVDGSKLGQVTDSLRIPYLSKNNVFTGVNTFPAIVLASGGSDTVATKSYARSITEGKLIDSTRIPYLTKNNAFTGNNTFPNINVSNNNDASGLSINGDITTIGDINNNDAGTTLSIDGHYNTLTINGLWGFTSGQSVSSISTDTAMTSNSNAILPTQKAVKSYVLNHQGSGGGSGYQTTANLSNDGTMAANSVTLYPSQQATKTYADGLVVGLLNDRGNYNASGNVYPSTGGSGTSGAIKKGDLWYISTAGTLGGVSVVVGSSIRALTDAPGQTSANWNVLNVGLGYTPENSANKSNLLASDSSSTVKYPTVQSVGRYAQALSNLSNNLTTDSASTTKYPSVQAITRFVKANSGVIPLVSYQLSVTGTNYSNSNLIPTNFTQIYGSGNSVKLPNNPPSGTQIYIASAIDCNIYSFDNSTNIIYGTYQSQQSLKSGNYYLFTFIDNDFGWKMQLIDDNTIQLNANLSNNIIADSASTTKYPSVNAVKNYVQANSSSLPYTEYACLITQVSTSAPVLTVLNNNTGGTFTATRLSSGLYSITFSGISTSTSKMLPIISCNNASGLIVSAYSYTSTIVRIKSLNLSGIPSDDTLTNTPFFLRIYP